jgi:hypothetical protein
MSMIHPVLYDLTLDDLRSVADDAARAWLVGHEHTSAHQLRR